GRRSSRCLFAPHAYDVRGCPLRALEPCVVDDLSVHHADDTRRVPCRQLCVVGDEQDRLAVALKLAKEFHHLVAAARVERSGGLIGEQKRGIIDQGPRNRDALLLAAAQTSRVATGDVCDAELVQQLPGAARRGIALQLRGDEDVLERGQV